MKIVITGSTGRLGGALVRRFEAKNDWEIIRLPRKMIDLSNPEQVNQVLSRIDFNWLINAAAMAGVDECEETPDLAYTINAESPGIMARCCRDKGAKMVQVSTDYVFNGTNEGLRSEEESPNPVNVYGKSKFEGEKLVQEHSRGEAAIIRTSWLFGGEGPDFMDSLIARAWRGDEPLEAIADKYSCPTYVGDFSDQLGRAISSGDLPGGVWHLCNSGACSWFQYGQAILEDARQASFALKSWDLQPIQMAAMTNFRAVRPIHTAMSCNRWEKHVGEAIRPWREAMRALFLEGEFGNSYRHPNNRDDSEKGT